MLAVALLQVASGTGNVSELGGTESFGRPIAGTYISKVLKMTEALPAALPRRDMPRNTSVYSGSGRVGGKGGHLDRLGSRKQVSVR